MTHEMICVLAIIGMAFGVAGVVGSVWAIILQRGERRRDRREP